MPRVPHIAGVLLLLVLVLIPVVAGARSLPEAASCPITPASSFWHADVSGLPVNAQSNAWITSIGSSAGLKADFGSGLWDGGPIGIPYTTVAGTQARVPVSFGYDDESDPGPYPVPAGAPIEGGSASSGDRHVLVVDRDACRLWELYSAYPQNGGSSWTAGSGATWDLNSNAMRPLGWTSGDAAGLPILPGLVRYDEVAAGDIDHVIRFTVPRTANAYVWPASHKAGSGGSSDPPMGAWFRLKASYDISRFSAANQVILRALKKHGMVVADNGSALYMSGVPDSRWNNSDLNALRSVPGSAFEAVDVSSLKVSSSSYAVTTGGAGSTPPPAPAPAPAPAPPPPPAPAPAPAPSPARIANPGFESNLAGWAKGTARTTLIRVCTVAHSGSCAAELGRTGSSGDAMLDDSPNSVPTTGAGDVYTASAWVKAPVGRKVRLRVRELVGFTLLRSRTTTVTGTGAWRLVTVKSAATSAGSSISVDVVASLPTSARVDVDDVALARG